MSKLPPGTTPGAATTVRSSILKSGGADFCRRRQTVSPAIWPTMPKLAHNTLKQRLAVLAQWHIDQGFPDPTKAPLVKKVLKGIRELHPEKEK